MGSISYHITKRELKTKLTCFLEFFYKSFFLYFFTANAFTGQQKQLDLSRSSFFYAPDNDGGLSQIKYKANLMKLMR